ncbi:MAG: ABC transporter ATP-binding protein, partial [Acidimicrobiales bacterium]
MGMRSFQRDRSVLEHRVKKGTTRRMLRFAVPYRRILSIFLPVVVIDAAAGAVNPLILREIIDRGILGKDMGLVVELAGVAAGLAIFTAALSLYQRR